MNTDQMHQDCALVVIVKELKFLIQAATKRTRSLLKPGPAVQSFHSNMINNNIPISINESIKASLVLSSASSSSVTSICSTLCNYTICNCATCKMGI